MSKAVWRLIICEPERDSRRFEMARSEVLLGRSEDCDLCLADPSVSGQHARIYLRGGVLNIQDLGSTNGSFVVSPGDLAPSELRSAMTANLVAGSTVTLGSTRIEVLGAPADRVSHLGLDPNSESTFIATNGSVEVERELESESTGEPGATEGSPPEDEESPSGDVVLPRSPTRGESRHAATTARIHRGADSDALLRTTGSEANLTLMRRRLPRLTLCGQGLQQVVDIQSTPFVIGRRSELGVDLVVRHEQVSSRHLSIEFSDGRFHVRDLASSNGTRINSTRIPRDQPHPLPPDSGLDVGPIHCLFSCLYDDDGRAIDSAEYTRAAQALVAEGLVGVEQLAAAEEALQLSRSARHLGEMLLSQPGTRLTVQRWLNALRRVREAGDDTPTGWRAIVGAASDWLGLGRGQ